MRLVLLAMLVLAGLCGVVRGQDDDGPLPPDERPAADAIEAYLERFGLTEVLAEHLREKLPGAKGEERIAIAERLGAIYAAALTETTPPDEAARIEGLSRELLDAVPDAGTYELRISLAKARYLPAERIAEKARLRLATGDEIQRAQGTLDAVGGELRGLAGTLTRRVRSLEAVERRGSTDIVGVREQLAEAQRLRALASYYAGWAATYQASLTGRSDAARDALRSFAVLLAGESESEPTLERLPRALLRREPVARAALGVAVCRALLNDPVDALAWLDELDRNAEVPESVREQVFGRRLSILAQDRRWDSLAVLVERERRAGRFGPATGEALEPLSVTRARLLAVAVLEALRGVSLDDPRRGAAEPIAAAALADLVTRGEVGHVLDLLGEYGTLPLGGDGFIVRYVRGLQAFERARQAHRASGADPERPIEDTQLRARYIDASGLLGQALEAPDATTFPGERGKCGLLLGLSMYYRGDLVQAARRLESVAQIAGSAEREEALWLALVALDTALDERSDAEATRKRDELAALYLTEFPATDRAATLLLRRAGDGLLDDEQAAELLLGVPRESPLYEAARRQAATRLYRVLRAADRETRELQAPRYLALAEEVLDADRRAILSARSPEEASSAADAAVGRVRRVLDIALSISSPDLALAHRSLELLGELSARRLSASDGAIEAELLFRRLQIAAIEGDAGRVETLLARLRADGGVAAESAARFLYNRALRAADDREQDATAHRELVERGRLVLSIAGEGARTSAAEASAVRDRIARAAAVVWELAGDEDLRDLAIVLDAEALEEGNFNADTLRRLGRLSEDAGRTELALDAWRTLSAATASGTRAWFEARYHAIRVLADIEPTKAAAALQQHLTLHPEGGPSPFDARFRELRDRLASTPIGVTPETEDEQGEGGGAP